MKKIIFSVLVLIVFFPLGVNAKEYCTVVSGNGKDIGSEIACGIEHFYVIDSNEDEIKMLSKYNLYVGFNFDKIKVDSNIYIYRGCNDSNCESVNWQRLYYFDDEQVNDYGEWLQKIREKYNLGLVDEALYSNSNYDEKSAVISYVSDDENLITIDGNTFLKENIKLYPYTVIIFDTDGFAMQNELALGVTGEKGKANYPIYATLPLFIGFYGIYNLDERWNFSTENYDNFEDGYINFDFSDDSSIYNYLNEYKYNLNNLGYDVSSVDMINIKELDDLVKNISGNSLPLVDWYRNSLASNPNYEDGLEYYDVGDLKEFLSDDYKWLWNTTYWTKTAVGNIRDNGYFNPIQFYFISSAGDICYSYSDCSNGIPRAGIRPVVTIPNNNLKYLIRTKTDELGTIEVVDSAFGGDRISFKASARRGLRLSGITITTDSNEKVEFNEEDISLDASGVYSISTNLFTMPFENVTIEANWVSAISVPDTLKNLDLGIIILLITIMIGGFGAYTFFRKKKI